MRTGKITIYEILFSGGGMYNGTFDCQDEATAAAKRHCAVQSCGETFELLPKEVWAEDYYSLPPQ